MRQTYTRAKDAEIRGCASSGLSLSKAAEKIGDGHTRHMIGGRAKRLGVSFKGGKGGRPRKDTDQ